MFMFIGREGHFHWECAKFKEVYMSKKKKTTKSKPPSPQPSPKAEGRME